MKAVLFILGLFLFRAPCLMAAPDLSISITGEQGSLIGKSASEDESEWTAKLANGRSILQDGRLKEAVAQYINPVISHYEALYKDSPKQIFCAGNNKQTMMYLMSAAVSADLDKESLPSDVIIPEILRVAGRKDLGAKSETIVLSTTWAEAYFLKAYALIEAVKIKEAQQYLKKAIYLSPYSANYWHELGHTHQMLKNWDTCIQVFRLAEEASEMSDEEYQNTDRARSWRGIGFASIELGKLDEAEVLFKKCLELNPKDEKARGELKYIAQLRNKKRG